MSTTDHTHDHTTSNIESPTAAHGSHPPEHGSSIPLGRDDLTIFAPSATGKNRALSNDEWARVSPTLISTAAWNERVADEVAARDADPSAHPYNPAAEWGEPDFRHPASDDEAAARTAHLDAQPRSPQDDEFAARVSEAIRTQPESVDLGIEMHYAGLQHDPDALAEATARYDAAVARDIAHGLLPPDAAERERPGHSTGDHHQPRYELGGDPSSAGSIEVSSRGELWRREYSQPSATGQLARDPAQLVHNEHADGELVDDGDDELVDGELVDDEVGEEEL